MEGQGGGPAGGGGVRPRHHRGFNVPDVRHLVFKVSARDLQKSKAEKRAMKSGSGNANLIENMTTEELQELYFYYLRSNGVGRLEFNVIFQVPRTIGDQGPEVNHYNQRSGFLYGLWAGGRREYLFLQILTMKGMGSATVDADMKTILKAIKGLKDELEEIHDFIKGRGRVWYSIPEPLNSEMIIQKSESKKKKSKK